MQGAQIQHKDIDIELQSSGSWWQQDQRPFHSLRWIQLCMWSCTLLYLSLTGCFGILVYLEMYDFPCIVTVANSSCTNDTCGPCESKKRAISQCTSEMYLCCQFVISPIFLSWPCLVYITFFSQHLCCLE